MTTIIGVKMAIGAEYSSQLQTVLSHYACAIQTRIGLHKTHELRCEDHGIILLHIVDESIVKYLQNDLLDIDEIELQVMKFN